MRKLAFCALLAFLLFLAALVGVYLARFPLIKYAAAKLGPTQNLAISLDLEGSLFTSLTVDHLKIVPTGPSEIVGINVDHVSAHYHLLKLIRGDFTHGIEEVEARNAFIELRPDDAVAEKLGHKKKQIMRWDDLFHNPGLFIRNIAGDNINFISHTPARGRADRARQRAPPARRKRPDQDRPLRDSRLRQLGPRAGQCEQRSRDRAGERAVSRPAQRRGHAHARLHRAHAQAGGALQGSGRECLAGGGQ
ncbi:MAG: hypothetical protein QM796_09230 [Chthoniobacteraceae bacterium]